MGGIAISLLRSFIHKIFIFSIIMTPLRSYFIKSRHSLFNLFQMRKIISFLFLLPLLVMHSCGSSSTKFEEVRVGGKFSIKLPDYMSSTQNLNDDATLQYGNVVKGIYVMVIEDNKKELYDLLQHYDLTEEFASNFEGYIALTAADDGMNPFLMPHDLDNIKPTTINGLKAINLANIRQIEDKEVYYRMAIIDGKSTYYQLITWASAQREARFSDDMEKIINSFKEL